MVNLILKRQRLIKLNKLDNFLNPYMFKLLTQSTHFNYVLLVNNKIL